MLVESPFLDSADSEWLTPLAIEEAKVSEPPLVVLVRLMELEEWSSVRRSDMDDDDDGANVRSDEDTRG